MGKPEVKRGGDGMVYKTTLELYEDRLRVIVREELEAAKPAIDAHVRHVVHETTAPPAPTPHPAGEPYEVRYATIVGSVGGVRGPDGMGSEYVSPHDRPAVCARLNRAFQLGYDKAKKEGR